ncbi:MAG: hypothetical protein Q7T78_16480 [Rhodoferax sp.]|nr:hypothetical protein [Rhodoferax sp.]
MAIGWLTALKLIPWSDVISNAPMVVEGAKKLWSAVAKKPVTPELSPASSQSAVLAGRVTTLEATVSDLHTQMVASSELIKALAEQNSQLIVRVETQRVRIIWLAVISVVTAGAAIGSLAIAMAGRAA